MSCLISYLPTYLLIYRAGLSQRGAPTLIPYFLHLPTPFPSPCIFPFPPLRLLSSSPSYLCGPIPLVQLRGLDSASSAGTGGAQPPNSVIHFKLKSAFGNSKFIQFFSAKQLNATKNCRVTQRLNLPMPKAGCAN